MAKLMMNQGNLLYKLFQSAFCSTSCSICIRQGWRRQGTPTKKRVKRNFHHILFRCISLVVSLKSKTHIDRSQLMAIKSNKQSSELTSIKFKEEVFVCSLETILVSFEEATISPESSALLSSFYFHCQVQVWWVNNSILLAPLGRATLRKQHHPLHVWKSEQTGTLYT